MRILLSIIRAIITGAPQNAPAAHKNAERTFDRGAVVAQHVVEGVLLGPAHLLLWVRRQGVAFPAVQLTCQQRATKPGNVERGAVVGSCGAHHAEKREHEVGVADDLRVEAPAVLPRAAEVPPVGMVGSALVVQDSAKARSASHPEMCGTVVSRKKGRWFVRLDDSGSEVSRFAKNMLLLPGDLLFDTVTHGGRERDVDT